MLCLNVKCYFLRFNQAHGVTDEGLYRQKAGGQHNRTMSLKNRHSERSLVQLQILSEWLLRKLIVLTMPSARSLPARCL